VGEKHADRSPLDNPHRPPLDSLPSGVASLIGRPSDHGSGARRVSTRRPEDRGSFCVSGIQPRTARTDEHDHDRPDLRPPDAHACAFAPRAGRGRVVFGGGVSTVTAKWLVGQDVVRGFGPGFRKLRGRWSGVGSCSLEPAQAPDQAPCLPEHHRERRGAFLVLAPAALRGAAGPV